MARTLTLDEWALEEFSKPIPSRPTLMRYAKNGMIYPLPFKAGRCWRVEASARFIGIKEKPVINKDTDPRLMKINETYVHAQRKAQHQTEHVDYCHQLDR